MAKSVFPCYFMNKLISMLRRRADPTEKNRIVSIALIDYNMGNLGSVAKALEYLGAPCVVVENAADLVRFDACILPGVGSFGDGMEALRSKGFDRALPRFIAADKCFLGICLGMQMLLESSEESPGVRGLGVFPGAVKKFRLDGLKVPHMGWNAVKFAPGLPLADGLAEEEYFYFVHSYFVPADATECAAACVYGHPFAAMLGKGRCFAAQFHPEKSQRPGLRMLENFLKIAGELS